MFIIFNPDGTYEKRDTSKDCYGENYEYGTISWDSTFKFSIVAHHLTAGRMKYWKFIKEDEVTENVRLSVTLLADQ